MKKKSIASIIIFIMLVFSSLVYSQHNLESDSIRTGVTYKFVLFDDTEIFGRVIYSDSLKIKVQDESNDIIMIVKDNLLYYSLSKYPSKYAFSLSLMGGLSLYTKSNQYYYYSDNLQSGFHADIAGIFYLSDTRAVKFDLGYSYLEPEYEQYAYPAIYPYYSPEYDGGAVSNYLFKGNILLGSLKPENSFMGYGSLGLGFHITTMSEMRERYYDYYDSTYRTTVFPSSSDVNAVISLGGGLVYRFSKHLGIHAEIEYNLVTTRESEFLFFGGRSYFPLRIGAIYTFY